MQRIDGLVDAVRPVELVELDAGSLRIEFLLKDLARAEFKERHAATAASDDFGDLVLWHLGGRYSRRRVLALTPGEDINIVEVIDTKLLGKFVDGLLGSLLGVGRQRLYKVGKSRIASDQLVVEDA